MKERSMISIEGEGEERSNLECVALRRGEDAQL